MAGVSSFVEQRRWVRVKGKQHKQPHSPRIQTPPPSSSVSPLEERRDAPQSKSFGLLNSEGFGTAPSISLESIREELRRMSQPAPPKSAPAPGGKGEVVATGQAINEDGEDEETTSKSHPYLSRKVTRELDEIIRPRNSFGISGTQAAAGLGLDGGAATKGSTISSNPALLAQEKVQRLGEMSPDLRPDLQNERRDFYTSIRGALADLKDEVYSRYDAKTTETREPSSDIPVSKEEQYQQAVLDFVAALDDTTLAKALQCGAIDPVLDIPQGEAPGGELQGEAEEDLLGEDDEDEDEINISKLLSYASGLEATQMLTQSLNGRPNDDVAQLLLKADSGDYSQFTEEDVQCLEKWEKETTGLVETNNVVLRKAASLDPEIAKSLATLDRTRRRTLLDEDFQKAMRYSMKADQLDRQAQQQYLMDASEIGVGTQKNRVLEETVNPLLLAAKPLPQGKTPVKPDVADDLFFARSKFAIPPPRADSGVPKQPKMNRAAQYQMKMIQRKRQLRREGRQRQLKDFQHRGRAGSPVQR